MSLSYLNLLDPKTLGLFGPLLLNTTQVPLPSTFWPSLLPPQDDEKIASPQKPLSFAISKILEEDEPIKIQLQSGVPATKSDAQFPPPTDASKRPTEESRASCENPGSPQNQHRRRKKQRKCRTIFTDKQLATLEHSFQKQTYLNVQDRLDLADRLKLTDTQVKTWYQNRRTKWKRQTCVDLEFRKQQENMMAIQHYLSGNSVNLNYYLGSSNPLHPLPPRATGLKYLLK